MLTIIGCGNLNRSDDGVGVVVARRLIERLEKHPVEGVRAFDCGTGGMDVMFRAKGSDALLILDASQTDSPPGTIYDVPGDELARDHAPSFSLHDFRWDHALAAGRRIFKDDFPEDVRVWLVEAKTLELGLALSNEVERAAETLYTRALARVADYAAQRHAGHEPLKILIRRGSIQLDRAVFDRYFGRHEGAILMNEGDHLILMPVDAVAGGILVKQKNLRGDRVVDATEFLRARGVHGAGDITCQTRWDADRGALELRIPEEAS